MIETGCTADPGKPCASTSSLLNRRRYAMAPISDWQARSGLGQDSFARRGFGNIVNAGLLASFRRGLHHISPVPGVGAAEFRNLPVELAYPRVGEGLIGCTLGVFDIRVLWPVCTSSSGKISSEDSRMRGYAIPMKGVNQQHDIPSHPPEVSLTVLQVPTSRWPHRCPGGSRFMPGQLDIAGKLSSLLPRVRSGATMLRH